MDRYADRDIDVWIFIKDNLAHNQNILQQYT